jgi:hypothetical protein
MSASERLDAAIHSLSKSVNAVGTRKLDKGLHYSEQVLSAMIHLSGQEMLTFLRSAPVSDVTDGSYHHCRSTLPVGDNAAVDSDPAHKSITWADNSEFNMELPLVPQGLLDLCAKCVNVLRKNDP